MSAGILFHVDITPPDFRPLFDGVNLNWDSLLSGAIGGLAILLLNILYGRAVAWWNRRQERKGLLRIIDAEVYDNNEVLKPMITDPDLAEQCPSRWGIFKRRRLGTVQGTTGAATAPASHPVPGRALRFDKQESRQP